MAEAVEFSDYSDECLSHPSADSEGANSEGASVVDSLGSASADSAAPVEDAGDAGDEALAQALAALNLQAQAPAIPNPPPLPQVTPDQAARAVVVENAFNVATAFVNALGWVDAPTPYHVSGVQQQNPAFALIQNAGPALAGHPANDVDYDSYLAADANVVPQRPALVGVFFTATPWVNGLPDQTPYPINGIAGQAYPRYRLDMVQHPIEISWPTPNSQYVMYFVHARHPPNSPCLQVHLAFVPEVDVVTIAHIRRWGGFRLDVTDNPFFMWDGVNATFRTRPLHGHGDFILNFMLVEVAVTVQLDPVGTWPVKQ